MTRGIDHKQHVWDPVPEGTLRQLGFSSEDGTTYEVTIRWVGGGWSQIVGVRVGQAYADGMLPAAFKEGADIAMPLEAPSFFPIDARELARIGADLEHFLEDYATTQRFALVWRDVDAGVLELDKVPATLGGREFKLLRGQGTHIGHEVRIAASLYRFFSEIGSRKPTEDVAAATGVSRATAARRIKDARADGLLGEARPGVAGERRTRGTR